MGAEPSRANSDYSTVTAEGFHCVHLGTQSVTMRLLATGRVLRSVKGKWRYIEAGVGVCEDQGSAGCARRHQSTSIGLLKFSANDQKANTKKIPPAKEG